MKSKEFMRLGVILYRSKKRMMRQFLKEQNLNYFAGMLLFEIINCPGLSQQSLSQLLDANESAVARSLLQLEKLQLIIRREDAQNRRRKLVFPTEEAQIFQKNLDNFLLEHEQGIFQELSSQELKIVTDLYQRVEQKLEDEV